MLIGQDTELQQGGGTAHKSMFICSYVESKTETSVAKAKDYIGGGHRTYFLDWVNNWGREGGDTAHTLLMRGTIGMGTPHNIESKSNSLN